MATQAELEQVRRALNRLSQAAQGDLQAVWDQLKTSDRVQVSRALTEGWEWVLERYGNMAATLAADFFEVEARSLNLTPRVQMAAPFDGPRANARLGWALSTPNQWGNVTVLLDELVKQPYRSTFQDSAHASGGGWARVPTGSHTCAFCLMLASRGGVYRSRESAGYGKRYHGKCVVPGTLVHGPSAKIALRRKYEGEVVTITTAAGHHLTVTPNHPILTRAGWVSAGLLRKGDDLLSALPGERHEVGGPHEDDAPTRVEDRFRALGMVRTAVAGRVPGAPEQFHGDGRDSEVEVVARDGLLWDEVQAGFGQPFPELHLTGRAGDEPGGSLALDGFGAGEVRGGVPSGPADGPIGSFSLSGALGGGHPTSSVQSSLGSTSDRDPGIQEPAAYGAAGHPQGVCDRHLALASEIPLDNPFGRLQGTRAVRPDPVIGIVVSHYSGHVYNLTTGDGWYFANSIVTHNCDCQPTLVRGPEDYPKGYDPNALYQQYEAGRAEAQSGDPKKILSAMRAQAGTN